MNVSNSQKIIKSTNSFSFSKICLFFSKSPQKNCRSWFLTIIWFSQAIIFCWLGSSPKKTLESLFQETWPWEAA
jgi:hypothetical protein